MNFLRLFNDPIGWAFLGSMAVWLGTEGYALWTKTEGDTFSERIWAWLAGRERRPSPANVRKFYKLPMPQPIRLGGAREPNPQPMFHTALPEEFVRKGIKLNTFRWFASAWLSLGLFIWLWIHFNLGLFAG